MSLCFSLVCAIFHLVWYGHYVSIPHFAHFFSRCAHSSSFSLCFFFDVHTHCASVLLRKRFSFCSLRMDLVVTLWLRRILRFVSGHSTIMTLWILIFLLQSFQPNDDDDTVSSTNHCTELGGHMSCCHRRPSFRLPHIFFLRIQFKIRCWSHFVFVNPMCCLESAQFLVIAFGVIIVCTMMSKI